MESNTLLIAATRLKQGLLAKATDGEYSDNDFQNDLAVLSADQHIEKILPISVRTNRSTADFRRDMQPGSGIPAKIGDIIGALLGDNGVFNFCDTSTVSGKDYRRGIKSLFEGAFAAYRNPAAHANLPCTKREAVEQIMLASQLMYVLDK